MDKNLEYTTIYLSEDQTVYLKFRQNYHLCVDSSDKSGTKSSSKPSSKIDINKDKDFEAYFYIDGTREPLNKKQYNHIHAIDVLHKNGGRYPVESELKNIMRNLYNHTPEFLLRAEAYNKLDCHFMVSKLDSDGKSYYHFHFPSELRFERVLNPAYPADKLISDNRESFLITIRQYISEYELPLVICAPDGYGKTAIIVQLYKQYFESPRNDDTQYLFLKYTPDIKQKIAYEIRTRNNLKDDETAYNAFCEYINKHKMIIFIDGLPDVINDANFKTIQDLAAHENIKLVMTMTSANKPAGSWAKFVNLPKLKNHNKFVRELAPISKSATKEEKHEYDYLLKAVPKLIDNNVYVYKTLCKSLRYNMHPTIIVPTDIPKSSSASKILNAIINIHIITERLTPERKIFLALLCALPNLDAISIKILKNAILGAKESDISFLIESGLIETYERVDSRGGANTTYCYMHPLMKKALYALNTKVFPRIDDKVAEEFSKYRGLHSFSIDGDKIIDNSFMKEISKTDDEEFLNTVRIIVDAELKRKGIGDDLNALTKYQEAAENTRKNIESFATRDELIYAWKAFYYAGYLLSFTREKLDEGIQYLNYSLSLAIYLHFNTKVIEPQLGISLIAKSADHLSFALSDKINVSFEDVQNTTPISPFYDPNIVAISRSNSITDIFNYRFEDPIALIKTAIVLRKHNAPTSLESTSKEDKKHYREYAWSVDNYGFTLMHSDDQDVLNEARCQLTRAYDLRKQLTEEVNSYHSDVAWTAHNLGILYTLIPKDENATTSALDFYDDALNRYENLEYCDDCKGSVINNRVIYKYVYEGESNIDIIQFEMRISMAYYDSANRTIEKRIVNENLNTILNRLSGSEKAANELKLLSGARVIILKL